MDWMPDFLENWLYAIVNGIWNMGDRVLRSLQNWVDWLISVAWEAFSWLPDHTPLDLPDPASFGTLLSFLGIFGRFIDLPVLFVVGGLLVVYESCVLLYAAYRAVLGLVPMFK